MQSTNNRIAGFFPGTEAAGVLLTSACLGFIHYTFLHRYFAPVTEYNRLVQSLLLAFSVCFLYSADHWLDLQRTGPPQGQYRAFKRYYSLVGVFSLTGSAYLFFLLEPKMNFLAMLVLALSVLYGLLKINRTQSLSAFYPLFISLTVSLALFIPPLGMVQQPFISGLGFYATGFIVAWAVCLLNLLIFGYLEMDKDSALGNRTLFAGRSSPIPFSWLWIAIWTLFIVAAVFAFWYSAAIPVLCYSALVIGVLFFRQTLKKQGIYRLILDAGLLFLCL